MRKQWLIHVAIWQHLIWAGLLIFAPTEAYRVTALRLPVDLLGDPITTAICYVCVSILTAISVWAGDAMYRHERLWYLALLACVAQQFLLTMSATGSVWVIAQGRLLGGMALPRGRLIAGQEIYILLALFHPLAVLEIFAPTVLGRAWERIISLLKWRPGSAQSAR